MVNQQALAQQWSEVRDRIRERWARISADDLPSLPGNVDQLVGSIQQKTGESRESIEAFLARITDEGQSLADEARHRLRDGRERLTETARHGAEIVRERYADAGQLVRRHPGQTVAVAFGLGLVCGVGLALALRGSRRQPPSALERGRAATGRLTRQMRHALADYLPAR